LVVVKSPRLVLGQPVKGGKILRGGALANKQKQVNPPKKCPDERKRER